LFAQKDAVQRHRLCIVQAYEKAVRVERIEHGVNIQAELVTAMRLVKKMLDACNRWLTDPEDSERYTLDPRAWELFVIYERPVKEGESIRWEKQRAPLDVLVAEVLLTRSPTLPNPRLVSCLPARGSQMKSSDIAKLLLKANDNLQGLLRLAGDIAGTFKQPQRNPADISFGRYNETVDSFTTVFRNVYPEIQRRQVVEVMAKMPEHVGEYMPFVEAELAGFDYRN